MNESLDPRVSRLPAIRIEITEKTDLDQLETYEVFVQPREGKPFQHEGAVHAADAELAFVLAKETFTRRFTCTSLWVVRTSSILVSPMTEGLDSVYNHIQQPFEVSGPEREYHIFHLIKRGKQHLHAGSVSARSFDEALFVSQNLAPPSSVIYNVWVIQTLDIRMTHPSELDLWTTLPEKKFRDASAYKGGDKLKDFLDNKGK